MINYKELRSELKIHYTQEKVACILSFIGYDVDRNFKFKLRDEKTPSASISRTGNITDFGSGWSGDIVAILHEYKDLQLGKATLYVAELLDVDTERFSQ